MVVNEEREAPEGLGPSKERFLRCNVLLEKLIPVTTDRAQTVDEK